jgi:hypothetical protein
LALSPAIIVRISIQALHEIALFILKSLVARYERDSNAFSSRAAGNNCVASRTAKKNIDDGQAFGAYYPYYFINDKESHCACQS